jgi:hypothetical protein
MNNRVAFGPTPARVAPPIKPGPPVRTPPPPGKKPSRNVLNAQTAKALAQSRPATPSAPAAPSAPATPSAPAAPSAPAVPNAPSAPAVPNAPSAPAVPNAPSAPRTPSARNTFKRALNAKNRATLRKTYKTANNNTRRKLRIMVIPYSPESNLLNTANEEIALRTANIPEIEAWNESKMPTADDIARVQGHVRLLNRMLTELGWAPNDERMVKLQEAKKRAKEMLKMLESRASNNVKENVEAKTSQRISAINLGTSDDELIKLLTTAKTALPEDKLPAYKMALDKYKNAKAALLSAIDVYQTYARTIQYLRGCLTLASKCSDIQQTSYEDAVVKEPGAKSAVIKRYSEYKTTRDALKPFTDIPLPEPVEDPFSIVGAVRSTIGSAVGTLASIASGVKSAIKGAPQIAKNAVAAVKQTPPKQAAIVVGKGAFTAVVDGVKRAANAATEIIQEEVVSRRRRATQRRRR